MEIGRITKKIICTIKDPSMNSGKIFMVELLNLDKSANGKYVVAIESRLDLGVGDIVLIVRGGAARRIVGNSEMPINAGISAKIDSINVERKYKFLFN